MSVEKERQELDAPPHDLDTLRFLLDCASQGTQPGTVIKTLTVRADTPEGLARVVIDSGEPVGLDSLDFMLQPVAGLRIIEASYALGYATVLDINTAPTSNEPGRATVTDLSRWGSGFAVTNIRQILFTARQSFTMKAQQGGVVKAFFGLPEAELSAGEFEPTMRQIEVGGMAAVEFLLARDVWETLGYVRLE